ncbi:hypothetical protein BDV93DRAFT_520304, partial [Ceratobasidium sp. AG-I]
MERNPTQQDSLILYSSLTSVYHPHYLYPAHPDLCKPHPHSLLAMDFITSIFFPVSPATEDHEVPVEHEKKSSNPYGFCVV